MADKREDAEARASGARQPRPRESGDINGPAAGKEDEEPAAVAGEQAKADRYLANWQRAEADLVNFRRRTEQERAELIKFANAALIGKIVPILDDFERAIAAVPEEELSSGWVEGIGLIERKLRSVLEQEGVTPIRALGREFDPHVHEAVMREDGEGNLDVVVEEFQKGYRLHDRVIRPAMVKVGKRESTFNTDEKE